MAELMFDLPVTALTSFRPIASSTFIEPCPPHWLVVRDCKESKLALKMDPRKV